VTAFARLFIRIADRLGQVAAMSDSEQDTGEDGTLRLRAYLRLANSF
jgi:hypothetical protein